jgi:hypothetical protein
MRNLLKKRLIYILCISPFFGFGQSINIQSSFSTIRLSGHNGVDSLDFNVLGDVDINFT